MYGNVADFQKQDKNSLTGQRLNLLFDDGLLIMGP